MIASLRRSPFGVATVAALAASSGDLLLLYIGNSQRPELSLPLLPPATLWLGAVLGVVGIPLYSVGYRACARAIAASSAGAARVVVTSGAMGAGAGALIHGLTAFAIFVGLGAAAPAKPPLQAVMESGPVLVGLWLFVLATFSLASITFTWHYVRTTAGEVRAAVLANPMLLTLTLMLVSMPNEWLRSFLAPAAPNLAHAAFFFVMHRLAQPRGGSPEIEAAGQQP